MSLDIEKIKNRMNFLNIGVSELSKRSGVPLRTVNNIVGGITTNPTIDNLRAIAKSLDFIVDDLIKEDKVMCEIIKSDEPYQPYQPATIAAHHDDLEWTDEELDEIERFKEFVKSQREKK